MKTKKAIILTALCCITMGLYAQTDTGRINKMPTSPTPGIHKPQNDQYKHKVDTAMQRKNPKSMPEHSNSPVKDSAK